MSEFPTLRIFRVMIIVGLYNVICVIWTPPKATPRCSVRRVQDQTSSRHPLSRTYIEDVRTTSHQLAIAAHYRQQVSSRPSAASLASDYGREGAPAGSRPNASVDTCCEGGDPPIRIGGRAEPTTNVIPVDSHVVCEGEL
jgi:hypothetical protein